MNSFLPVVGAFFIQMMGQPGSGAEKALKTLLSGPAPAWQLFLLHSEAYFKHSTVMPSIPYLCQLGPFAGERLVLQSTAVALKRSSSTAKAEVADDRSNVRTLDSTICVRGVEIGHVEWEEALGA